MYPIMVDHFDVLIIGAGVSGIGAACHLKMKCPGKTYAILERRESIGGTWDLFKYPGIRSDSDMLTFGFNFRPWHEPKILADGPAIKKYLIDTAKEYGVNEHIHYQLKFTAAAWSSREKRWTITTIDEKNGTEKKFTCWFLINCTGYYKYDAGYKPEFPGEKNFKGAIIHPQQWPENLDYAQKKVVVIGSGATAITLVPAMSKKAAHVTMLQRSPTYIASIPAVDKISQQLSRFLPKSIVYGIARARNIILQRAIFWTAKEQPNVVRRLLQMGVSSQLENSADMRHFTPKYNPWDERLCVVPDGDLFEAIKSGKASVETDEIETFTEKGIRLKSGKELNADIIVSATGLELQILGGADITVDGVKKEVNKMLTYKSVLGEGTPNSALIFGYTNASWTLKVDIACEYICRLINYMDKHNYTSVVAYDRENNATEDTVMGSLSAGYIRRAKGRLPLQGKKGPWRVTNDYFADTAMLVLSPVEDANLEFN